MPGHATPTDLRKHSDEAVVFALAGTGISTHRGETFDEATAEEGEMHLDRACDLMEFFLSR
jgi:2,3-bisphosphoglycerate-independent phosphoglycerate mutase